MKKTVRLAGILAALLIATPALALKIDMTPGLWEHSFSVTSQGGEMDKAMKEMQAQLANMPAEQRKMMEDMMAAQGISFDASNANTTVKVCVTQEEIDQGALPQPGDDCTQEITQQSKNKFKVIFSCNTSPASSGTSEIHFADPKNYTGQTVVVTDDDGKTETMNMTQSGKWLAADCGTFKRGNQ